MSQFMVLPRRRIFAAFFCVLLILPSCQSACNKEKKDDADNKTASGDVAAVVNGVRIPAEELNVLHKRATDQYTKTKRVVSETLDKSLRGGILRKMIDDEIIRQRAEKEGVKVDRVERVDALEKYKQKMGGPKAFSLFLERQNLTEEQIEKTVVADLQRDKLIQKLGKLEEPTDDEIERHFSANQKLYTVPEMVRVRHILLKLNPSEPKEKADVVLKKAQQILEEARKPGASFEALVQKYSEGPSVKTGGDLGFFPRGKMTKPFEDLSFRAPVKTLAGPVRTDFGYHILYIEDKTPQKTAELAQVRDRIVEFIKRNKRAHKSEDLLADMRKSAKVVISDSSMTYEEYMKEAERGKMTNQTAEKADKEE